MSKVTIQNPKVFISYAWGSEEYQNRVLAFAESLVRDGVDVVLDKWNLSEGNDTYAFMEKCVNDTAITNVLMLLDPTYAQKANAHEGGVGVETQIISSEVYQKTEQNKFIPIVFERDAQGDIHKPTYLQSRLHFDLSRGEKYDIEYQRLVKHLYGIEIYEKPELGPPPKWLEEPGSKSLLIPSRYDTLRGGTTSRGQEGQLIGFLADIQKEIVEFTVASNITGILERYAQMRPLRDDYLHLLKNYFYVENSVDAIASFLEHTHNTIWERSDSMYNLKRLLIHEIFIYTVSYILKQKDYINAGKLLGKTYFDSSRNGEARSFNMFYCSSHEEFSVAVCKRDNKNYYSGVAKYWVESIDTNLINQTDFVFGDLLCYNVSVFGNLISDGWNWFPLTYVYDSQYDSCIKLFAQKLASCDQAEKVLPLFSYETIEQLRYTVNRVITDQQRGLLRDYRYPEAFSSAPLLCEYVKGEDIGKFR